MTKVLLLIDHYLPGYRYGGTLRTVSNMVEQLGGETEFRIVTRNHDLAEAIPYSDVQTNQWNRMGKAWVYYASSRDLSLVRFRRLLQKTCAEISPDLVFLNGFFARLTMKFLLLRRFNALPNLPIVLAPRGQLSPGSLQVKSSKKQLYLTLTLKTGLYKNLVWQAASPPEEEAIAQIIGKNSEIHLAPNIPARVSSNGDSPRRPEKVQGAARFVFLSRISIVKNLRHVLEVLDGMSGKVTLDICGPIDDSTYWKQCQARIKKLSPNVQVTYRGAVPLAEVSKILGEFHFLILPTFGESFGHVIIEALLSSCPVIISDQTPWCDLQTKQAGWDLPLGKPQLWHQVLRDCMEMDNATYQHLAGSAREFALDWINSTNVPSATSALFGKVLKSAGN